MLETEIKKLTVAINELTVAMGGSRSEDKAPPAEEVGVSHAEMKLILQKALTSGDITRSEAKGFILAAGGEKLADLNGEQLVTLQGYIDEAC